MIYNVIGPPGAGKTTYIRKRFGFSPPMRHIDDEVFDTFVQRKVFEHTGLNPRINQYLAGTPEPVTTIWLQPGAWRCIQRILKDGFSGKATLKQTFNRLKILRFYHHHRKEIYHP
ncbi:hypothetical protein [Desulfatitalea alkaliphila]|uniref:Uncharacterized protein n=1 Tax=Desulfatitalea alkaliphila TaxID=2929485 RepID=A0AA41R7L0_9BACT|nr:hypothetical protein [Desulfatitalea alkaliphila]MCJ8502685.1 hypothetical protein [Desulfatitalea alkaliphila]